MRKPIVHDSPRTVCQEHKVPCSAYEYETDNGSREFIGYVCPICKAASENANLVAVTSIQNSSN